MNKLLNGKMVFIILFILISYAGIFNNKEKRKSASLQTNDDYRFIAVNECLMWLSNNGDGCFNPQTGGSGFYWPGGAREPITTAVFEDGILIGAKTNDPNSATPIKVEGSTYLHGMQAGKILDDGTAGDPDNPRYRIYRIRKNWQLLSPGGERDNFEKDYNEWPVEDGAPWVDTDGDGIFTRGIDKPDFIGDEVIWFVMNDLDTARTLFLYGSEPIGIEMQVTVYAFERVDFLRNAVFKKVKIINKSDSKLFDSYVSCWSDDDLGDAIDDYVGCDTTLNIAYTWNGANYDYIYGDRPPAIGKVFLQTPAVEGEATDTAFYEGNLIPGKKNLDFSAFSIYIGGSGIYKDPIHEDYSGTIEIYNQMQGLLWDGSPIFDPYSGEMTRFMLAGDPVAGEGWYEGEGWPGDPTGGPGDRRYLASFGPFDFQSGDTIVFEYAYLPAQAWDNLSSIKYMKEQSAELRNLYFNNFRNKITSAAPETEISAGDKTLNIYWQPNVEDITLKNLEYHIGFDSLNDYKFEGYRIYQYENQAGDNPIALKTFDLKNDIWNINDYQYQNGEIFEKHLFNSDDEGIVYHFTINKDYLNDAELLNEQKYYFGARAYFYSENSMPRTYFTKENIIEAIPRKSSIDYQSDYSLNEIIDFNHTRGKGDGTASIKIIDLSKLSDYKYKITFESRNDTAYYNLLNETTGDTLINMSDNFSSASWNISTGTPEFNSADTLGSQIIDGFAFRINDLGNDSLKAVPTKYRVEQIYETNGPGGGVISPPVPVWSNTNSTGEFHIESYNDRPGRQDYRPFIWQTSVSKEGLGYTDYEIRFGDSSYYYYSGYNNSLNLPINKDDRLAEGKVPFSVWDLGESDSDTDDVRLMIKILDNSYQQPERAIPDSQWTQFPNGSWEEIYVYKSGFDPLNPPLQSGAAEESDFRFGKFIIAGSIPQNGTILKLTTYKPLSPNDEFEIELKKADFNDVESGKNNIDKISVFPNPCFVNSVNRSGQSNNIIFTNLPNKVIIRIYSLGGVFVKRLDKDDDSERLSWDLRNKSGEFVGSGVYLAYVEMPAIGNKLIKLAVIF